jgi:hypothetical protein
MEVPVLEQVVARAVHQYTCKKFLLTQVVPQVIIIGAMGRYISLVLV